jgi:hypothetical protein
MVTPGQIIRKMEDDLLWRGPNGKTLGHIVLSREDALELIMWIKYAIRPECVSEIVGD